MPAGATGESTARPAPDEPPPFLGSWGRLYAIVFVNLVVLIVLFHLFTRAFE